MGLYHEIPRYKASSIKMLAFGQEKELDNKCERVVVLLYSMVILFDSVVWHNNMAYVYMPIMNLSVWSFRKHKKNILYSVFFWILYILEATRKTFLNGH
jgi:hypothetical protein